MNRGILAALLAAAVGGAGTSALGAYSFTTIDVAGATKTSVFGIAGSVVIGTYVGADGHDHGFTYSGGVYTTMDAPGAADTSLRGVGVGHTDYVGEQDGQPFWNSNGTYYGVSVPATADTKLTGTSGGGLEVGNYAVSTSGGVVHNGFAYLSGSYTTITGPTGAVDTYAEGVASFTIVGYYTDSAGLAHGFTEQNTSGVDGSLHPTSFKTLDAPLGVNGTFIESTNQSQAAGYYLDANNVSHGLTYNPGPSGNGVYQTLDDPLGVNGTAIYGMASTSTYVGCYVDSAGITHGFLATQIVVTPEPATLLLIGAGFVMLVYARPLGRRRFLQH